MAEVTVFTAERMQQIEDNAITGAYLNGLGELVLVAHDGTEINVGVVKGDPGQPGTPGDPGQDGTNGINGANGADGWGVVFLDDGESTAGIPDGTKICRRYP